MTKGSTTIGLDLSDETGTYVIVDEGGEVVGEGKVRLTLSGISKVFGTREPARLALEVGTHSPWVSRALEKLGHDVIVANPRQLRLISHGAKKSDRLDAETLARLARFDPALLKPVRHRGEQAQADLALLRAREALVRSRTALVNSARGLVKAQGGRLPKCSAESFATKAKAHLPELLLPALAPMLSAIASLTEQIKQCMRQLKRLAQERYAVETEALRQVDRVGPLTSLCYVLVLEEPQRFRRSRQVGAYLGLTTRQQQSGQSAPQLRITKAGDAMLRTLLVQAAHRILGPFGKDSDLRRWGLRLAGSGNQARKNKAVVAVARKLAVLLHRLWLSGAEYEPLRQAEAQAA